MSSRDDFVARFAELFGVAYRAAYPILGSREDAEDVAQEALARLFARLVAVKSGAVVPWVARVSTNLAIDRWRRLQRDRARQSAGHAVPVVDARRVDLVRALRALPRRQRDVVVMRHLLDYSERDTAAALGWSPGTVKSTTARALDRLREMLGPEWAME